MRKLLLTTAIVLLTSSAFAGSRGLSAPQPAEPQRPFRQAEVTILPAPGEQPAATTTTESAPQSMHEKLKAAGELRPDGTPAKPAQTPPPVQAAPVRARPASAPVQAQTTAQAQPQSVQKPARKRVVRNRESGERKARRIAARFGIYW